MVNNKMCMDRYEKIVNGLDNKNDKYSLFEFADCIIKGFDIDFLRNLLTSIDVGIILDGLFVCQEIGNRNIELTGEIDILLNHSDTDVRNMAHQVRGDMSNTR